MRISTTTHYASRLLLDLAVNAHEAPITASKLARHTGIPIKFVEKIIRPLKAAGMVKSMRGALGGHYLGCRPEEVTLGRVVRLMDGGIRLAQCAAGDEECNRCHDCRTRAVWRGVTEILERELDSITLADMMGESHPRCWGVTSTGTEG